MIAWNIQNHQKVVKPNFEEGLFHFSQDLPPTAQIFLFQL